MINNSISEQDDFKASIGYWASQEQYSMQQLIDFVKEAEKGGIITTMTSDISIPGGMMVGMVILHGFGQQPLLNERRTCSL